ncbi:MAG TPA: BREX system ATP-binding domain-containing protein [Longimicrobiales bacterium]|nr:BREX system ATP-binding domain-containing protein [Longimicrobiales bacterium]
MTGTLHRRLAAVMFTDMAGYTALMHEDEAAALRSRARHRQTLEAHLAAREGELLQYFGDGSLSIFRSSLDAVEAAIDVQRELGGDPAVRIGIHSGDIAFDAQGAYGDAVNIAARLEARATPGGVLISGIVYEDIRRHPLEVVSCGSIRLKHIPEPVPTYALAVQGLSVPEMNPWADGAGDTGRREGLPPEVMTRLEGLARRTADPPVGIPSPIERAPIVGRADELASIRSALDRAEDGRASALFIRGGRGVGKTRLAREALEDARSRGWTVLRGRAHPGERREPYAPFSDAFMPLLGDLDGATLAALTPGRDAALCELFPALGPVAAAPDLGPGTPGAHRTRLYWQFATLVARLAGYRPLLLVLEDLDFTDQASLDLLEFALRQSRSARLVVIGEYAGTDVESSRRIRKLEQSLVAEGIGRVLQLGPLQEHDVVELVGRAFDLEPGDAESLGRAVHRWTGGNPFLLTGTVQGLLEAGVLDRGSGRWRVGDLQTITPPASVQDAVLVWTDRLGPDARDVARILSVLGREASYELLKHVCGMADDELAPALEELLRHQLLNETESRWTLTYTFRNPLIRETMRSQVPLPRRRELHGRIAQDLETFYGDGLEEHADELAYHFGRAHPGRYGAKALRYLVAAGEAALRRHANLEARAYLQEAHELLEARPAVGGEDGPDLPRVLGGLARARRRSGDASGSLALWRRLLGLAGPVADPGVAARLHRQLGLTHLAAGALEEAVEAFEAAAEGARAAGDIPLVVRARLSEAFCHQSTGQPHRAAEVVEDCLQLAEAHGDPGLLGQVHRSRIQYNIWTGEIERAREAADRALALSRESGDRSVEFWSLWARAALEGLLGNTAEMAGILERCRAVARDVGSPFFDLATSELDVELAYARGEWDHGLAVAEEALELARSAGERLVRPRILVWASLIHLGRGDYERADALTREAWEVSRADRAEDPGGVVDLHTVVPAHIGRAAVALATGEWAEAVRIAEAGLRVADRSGYVVWAIHHILPIIGEASIHARDLDRAFEVGARMRREADRVGHPLGIAWADACDAVLTWLTGDAEAGARSLRRGAEALEAIPMTYEAARLRRQLAGRLAEVGDVEGARAELEGAREDFLRLGARPELAKVESQLQELDGR